MALHRILISEELYVQPKDLPWANEYVKGVEDLGITYFVKSFTVYESGLMAITPCFKAYIHKGTSLHKHLMEALEVFVQQPKGSIDEIVLELMKKGKVNVLTDDERKSAHWFKHENNYVQVYQGTAKEENIASINPFLAGMGLHSRTGACETVEQGSVLNIAPKASRRATRAN
jgi:hypothetical protein